jgi:hypothetical protein
MRYLTPLVVMLFFALDSHSQTYEIGPYVGGANYIGDIGPTNYVNPNTLVIGGVFKWNRSTRHAFRLSVLHAKVQSDDADSDVGYRKQRGLSFENSITEVSLGIEYTFWEYDLHTYRPQFSPYLYTGITVFNYNSLTWERNADGTPTRVVSSDDGNWNFSLPFIIGVKGSISDHFVLALEAGPRYTFGDNLDGGAQRGANAEGGIHPNTNDWYVFAGLTLTYTFGRKPCFCEF